MRFVILVMLLSGSAFGQQFSVRSCNGIRSCNNVIVQQHIPVHSHVVAPVVANVFQQPIALPVPVLYNYPIAQQGNTIYGYAQAGVQQYRAPNTVDLAVLYSQANRLAEQSQQLAAQANAGFQELVKQEALLQNSLSNEIVLRLKIEGNSIKQQEYNLIAPPQQLQQNGICQDNCVQPQQVVPQQQMVPQASAPQSELTLDSVVQDKCYSCHNAKNAKGGLSFDMPVSVDMQQSIIDRITTNDTSISMPRLADGTAAPKMSQQELDVFYRSMGVKK